MDFVFVSNIIHRREEYRNGRAMGPNQYVAHLDPFGKVSVHFCHLVTVHSRTLFKMVGMDNIENFCFGVAFTTVIQYLSKGTSNLVSGPESQKSFVSAVLLPFTAVHFSKVLEKDAKPV